MTSLTNRGLCSLGAKNVVQLGQKACVLFFLLQTSAMSCISWLLHSAPQFPCTGAEMGWGWGEDCSEPMEGDPISRTHLGPGIL